MIKRKFLFDLAQLAIGVIFVWASVYKLVSPGDFAREIFNYKILPPAFINPLALFLPPLQLLCGLSLIFRRLEKGAIILTGGMLLIFIASVTSALLRGLNVSCGCFQAGGGSATWITLVRDFGFLLLAVLSGVRIFRKNEDGLKWS